MSDIPNDGLPSWYAITVPQSGNLQFCQLAGYSLFYDCINGDPSTPATTSAGNFNCQSGYFNPRQITLSANTTLYVLVQAGFGGGTVEVRFQPDSPGASCAATCYDDYLPTSQIAQCENFEAYQDSFGISQFAQWQKFFPNADDAFVNTYTNINERYLRLTYTSDTQGDVLYRLGNRTSGRYRLSWEMFVIGGRSAYYNIQHVQQTASSPNWAYEVFFSSNGSGQLRIGDQSTGATAANFSYNNGNWNQIMQIIDLDADKAELWINGAFIYSWQFSRGSSPLNQLGGVNFYAAQVNGTGADYAVDNVCLWRQLDFVSCPLVFDPVCVDNGQQYSNTCWAASDGYTPAEWEAGVCTPQETCIATSIECGDFLQQQSTANESNTAEASDYGSCADQGVNYSGKDKFYEIVVTENRQYRFVLDILNLSDLDLFLLDDCIITGSPGIFDVPTCLEASTSNTSSKEILDVYLDPGTYYLSVDSKDEEANGNFNLRVACDCSCSEPAGDEPIGNVKLCENFELFDLGGLVEQSTRWGLLDSEYENGNIVTQNDEQVLEIFGADFLSDLTYSLDGQSSGRYRLSKRLFVEAGSAAEFGVYHQLPVDAFSPGNLAYQVSFSPDGSGQLTIGGDSEPASVFSYRIAKWNDIMQIIDIDANTAELWVNQSLVFSWAFSSGGAGNSNVLDGLRFTAGASDRLFIDDICLWEVGIGCGGISCGNGEEPVCVKNGLQYDCAEAARCQGYISGEWGACFSICDYGGQFIFRGDTYSNSTGGLDLAPSGMASEACIQNAYDTGVPAPLYADIYVFSNDDAEDIISIFNSGTSSTRAFVFACECPGDNLPCEQVCLGEVDGGFNGNNLPEGFYYIAVLSGDQFSDYEFNIFPLGNCDPNPSELACGDSITAEVTGAGNNFDNLAGQEFDAYADCYSGIRPYNGEDVVYKFVLPEPAFINMTLEATEATGLFLFNYLCGRNCIAYTENSLTGGTATLDSLYLTAGTYYAIVDQAEAGGTDGTFSLFYECLTDDNFTLNILFDNDNPDGLFDCPTNIDALHEVGIESLAYGPNGLNQLQHHIAFVTQDSLGNWRPVSNASNYFNGNDPMSFDINQDQTGDEEKCGYYIGDSLAVYLTDYSNGYPRHSLCELEFEAPNGADITEGPIFTPDGVSRITRMTPVEIGGGSLSNLYETVNASGGTTTVDVQTSADWSATIINDVPWLTVDPALGSGPERVQISVSPNPGYIRRSASIRFSFGTTPPIYHFLLLEQRGQCGNPDFTLVSDNSNTAICAGGSVTLSPQMEEPVPGLYEYSWSNGATTPSIAVSPLSDQDYLLTVTEKNCGAQQTRSFTVNVEAPPPPPQSGGDVSICEGEPLEPLSVNSSSPVRWYASENGGDPLHEGPIFLPDAPGNYFAEAYLQGLSCPSLSRTEVRLTSFPNPVVSAGDDIDLCIGETKVLNGTFTGGSGAYETIHWSGGLPPVANPPVSPQSTTSYTLNVVDTRGCSSQDTVVVWVRDLPTVAVEQAVDATCNLSNGSLAIEAAGGTPPYSFLWSDADTNAVRQDLASGVYFVTATDQYGCTASRNIEIQQLGSPEFSALSADPVCLGGTSTLSAQANGGTGALTYTWSNGLGTGPLKTITPEATTTYQVTVQDENNCTDMASVELVVHPLPEILLPGAAEVCRGAAVTLSSSASGGTGPYQFTWSDGLGFSPEVTFIPDDFQTYTLTVVDDNDCASNAEVQVSLNEPPTFELATTNSNCGEQNGTAAVSITAGTPPFSYQWSTGGNGPSIANLSSGNYEVTVEDGNGCGRTSAFVISESEAPSALIPANATICSGSSANLSVEVEGGTPPYSYAWSTGDSLASVTLMPDTSQPYFVTVTDDNNCSAVAQATVTVRQAATLTTVQPAPTCPHEPILLQSSPGGSATNLQWSSSVNGGSFSPPAANVANVIYTPPLNYTGNISFILSADADPPCPSVSTALQAVINPIPDLITTALFCEQGFETYSVQLSTNADSIQSTAGTVVQGNGQYTIIGIPVSEAVQIRAISGATGCEKSLEVVPPVCNCLQVVNEAPAILGQVSQERCEGQAFDAFAVDAGPGLTADWYDAPVDGQLLASNTLSFTPTQAGTYYAEALDTITNCRSPFRTPAMTAVWLPSPEADAGPDQMICPGSNAVLQAGSGDNYTYVWQPGNQTGAVYEVSPDTSTAFVLTVAYGGSGCTDTDTVTVDLFPVLIPGLNVNEPIDCPGDRGILSAMPSGGPPPYLYEWSNDSIGSFIYDLPPGTYSVTVTDANGCARDTTVTLEEKPPITVEPLSNTPDTLNQGLGALNVQISGGTPPYTVQWYQDGTLVGTTEDLDGLLAGSYSIEVTDSLGCTSTAGPFNILSDIINFEIGNTVTIYPNPTNGWCQVVFGKVVREATLIECYNAIGQRIERRQLEEGAARQQAFDLSDQAPGVYWFTIRTKQGQGSWRLILE